MLEARCFQGLIQVKAQQTDGEDDRRDGGVFQQRKKFFQLLENLVQNCCPVIRLTLRRIITE